MKYANFMEFIEAFKWVTSFLRKPGDFGLIAADLAEQLLEQKAVYAEVTLSVGVMLLRKQEPQANFEAILEATKPFEERGLRLNWIFDAVRQFGAEPAMQVVEAAHRCKSPADCGVRHGRRRAEHSQQRVSRCVSEGSGLRLASS